MPVNLDTHQVFTNYDINKINNAICLSNNPKTGLFLKENIHLINNYFLSINTSEWVIDFILDNDIVNIIDFNFFSDLNNNKIVNYLIQNPEKISWRYFSRNTNDKAVEYLIKNFNKINWKEFSKNNNDKAVDYLLENIDNINLRDLFRNNNDKIVDYIIKNINYNYIFYYFLKNYQNKKY